ncbi:hypothetical protein IFO70_22605 [Phormidium tenue FACHB-886]|nr:hypothetical protein [Phormidium tenue FACHB-886]
MPKRFNHAFQNVERVKQSKNVFVLCCLNKECFNTGLVVVWQRSHAGATWNYQPHSRPGKACYPPKRFCTGLEARFAAALRRQNGGLVQDMS